MRARASSLNFHDYAVASGAIPVPDGRIPLSDVAGKVPTMNMTVRQQTMKGITVGTRADQQALVRALGHNGIKPVIDSTFPLEELADAFRHQESQLHFGKIAVNYP